MQVQIINIETLVGFWLCFTRWMAITFQLPLFDGMPIPAIVKVLVTFLITFAFYPFLQNSLLADIAFFNGESGFWLLTIFNVSIGLFIGYMVKVIVSIFIGAGSLMSQQAGLGAVRYFDPTQGSQVGPFETLIKWSILMAIITGGALFPMFRGIFNSFFTVTFIDITRLFHGPDFFFDFFKGIFISSLILASPLVFTNLMMTSVLAVIARLVPQMNVLMISFVVNIAFGLLVFLMISSEILQSAFNMYVEFLGKWFAFVN